MHPSRVGAPLRHADPRCAARSDDPARCRSWSGSLVVRQAQHVPPGNIQGLRPLITDRCSGQHLRGGLGPSPRSRRGTPMTEWRDAISWCAGVPRPMGVDMGSYGTWSSPVSASEVACTLRLGEVRFEPRSPGGKRPTGRRQGSIMLTSPTARPRGWRASRSTLSRPRNSCWLPGRPTRPVVTEEAAGTIYLFSRKPTHLLTLSTSRVDRVFPRVARPDPVESWGVR